MYTVDGEEVNLLCVPGGKNASPAVHECRLVWHQIDISFHILVQVHPCVKFDRRLVCSANLFLFLSKGHIVVKNFETDPDVT